VRAVTTLFNLPFKDIIFCCILG